jgi:hypothetical protein
MSSVRDDHVLYLTVRATKEAREISLKKSSSIQRLSDHATYQGTFGSRGGLQPCQRRPCQKPKPGQIMAAAPRLRARGKSRFDTGDSIRRGGDVHSSSRIVRFTSPVLSIPLTSAGWVLVLRHKRKGSSGSCRHWINSNGSYSGRARPCPRRSRSGRNHRSLLLPRQTVPWMMGIRTKEGLGQFLQNPPPKHS